MASALQPVEVLLLQSLVGLVQDIGADPAKWPMTVPGALTVALGRLQIALPGLLVSEAGQLQAQVLAKLQEALANAQKA